MGLNSFEKSFFEDIRNDNISKSISDNDDNSLVRFALWNMLAIGKMIRSARILPTNVNSKLKEEGSPVTVLEFEIEEYVKKNLNLYLSGASFVGEESGGKLPREGLSLALDPIDGTWSFLSHSESAAVSLTFFRDRVPFIGVVLNPATGELAYVLDGNKTRLIQLPFFDEEINAVNLPTAQQDAVIKNLVNLHPSKMGATISEKLYHLWKEGNLKHIKSLGGSPAWSLVEAAKGYYSYINLWTGTPAVSYDLASGILLIRGAGGDVVDMKGNSIKYIGHEGLFVAGITTDKLYKILELVT